MSSGQDSPLSAGGSQQPRKGSRRPPPPRNPHFMTTPKSAFRRPPPPRDADQQFSQPTSRSAEPIGTGTGPKPGVTFKSLATRTTPKSIPAHSHNPGQHHRTNNSKSPFLLSTKTSRTTNLSGRISSQFHATPSQAFRRPPTHTGHNHVPAPAKTANIMTTKTSQSLSPLWQELDDTFEKERLRVKRRREGSGIYTARRITDRQTSTAKSKDDTIDVEQPDRPKANIRPKLRINQIDQPDNSDSDHDEPRYRPQAKVRSRKSMTVARPQIAPKRSAARKVNYVNTTSSEEFEDDSDVGNKEPSNSEEEEEEEEDQLDPDQYDVDMEEESPPRPLRASTPPEIMILDSPPKITIPLPQIDRNLVNTPTAQSPSIEPPDELITALESFTLSTIRMQKTHQLPFLPRNVREGFLSRCRVLGVPIYSDNRQLSLCVRYDYVAGLTYKTEISSWLCPLCEVHGTFRTREMLACHLQWDHAEVFSEWGQMDDTEESESWNLQLVIPEPEIIQLKTEDSERESYSIPSVSQTPSAAAVDEKTQSPSIPSTPTTINPEATPIRNTFSPFPYVSLSPTTQRSTTTNTSTTTSSLSNRTPSMDVETKNITQLVKLKIQDPDFPPRSLSLTSQSTSTTTTNTSTTTSSLSNKTPSMDVETKNISRLDKLKIQDPDLPPRSLSLTSQSTSTKSSSNTRSSITSTIRSSTTTTTRPERPSRYPTPPPADNPLGPAAQPPYLPAKSEYGGPTVKHSYRPGGPCLFDLLNTLPLEPFGVLDWEILDREEEIYESDDVKEEYKVMHALWARWIMLNRNKFIANYYKGMIAFVDEYWKIIHRAAGWDALRYWLLMLLSNRFLTGHDVAQVLVHYEDLVGMAFW